jgi:hypothetical protein
MARLCHAQPTLQPLIATTTPWADHPIMPFDPTAVVRKLKLDAARSPVVLGASAADRAALTEARGSTIPDRLDGSHDWILLYAVDRSALDQSVSTAASALASPGTLWIAFPKGSSKLQTDLTRDTGWDAVRGTDLMWLALVSIDETWSAFSLRHHRPGEPRQAFR